MRYYHVIKRQAEWHVYADHGEKVLAADTEQAVVMRAARLLARQSGAKIVLHAEQEPQKSAQEL